MSLATAEKQVSERGPKLRGTEWWYPPEDTPLNAAVPYVVQIVDDALSMPQSRVLACITNLKDGARRLDESDGSERGFMCDPGGYSRIARKTGLCRKSVYNAVHALIAKKVIRVWKVQMKGRQILKTLYFARHFGDILPTWRSDEEFPDVRAGKNPDGTWKKTAKLFHTARRCIVVRKRSKQFITIDEAAEWKMNAALAPSRGYGKGLAIPADVHPVPENVKPMPPAAPALNDEDVQAVYFELLRHTSACIKDAIDVINDGRREAKKLGYEELGFGGPLPALTIAELVQRAGSGYKATRHYPRPTIGWFLGGPIRREVSNWLKYDWEQRQA